MAWKGEPRDAFVLRAERHVPIVRKLARWQFEQQRRHVKASTRDATDVEGLLLGVDAALRAHAPDWLRFYRRAYVVVGQAFAPDGIPPSERLAPRPHDAREEPGVGVSWGAWGSPWWDTWTEGQDAPAWYDPWLQETVRYSETTGAEKVVAVDEHTRRRIQRQVRRGIERGEGISDLKRRIDRLYLDRIIPNRSEVIARTETLTAARASAHHATVAGGYAHRILKSWLATGDDRTRDTHLEAEANNHEIPYTEPFLVRHPTTGAVERLMFPGDTSQGASAANIVQCRCDETKRLHR